MNDDILKKLVTCYEQSPSKVKTKVMDMLDAVLNIKTMYTDSTIIKNIMEYLMNNVNEQNREKIISTLMNLIKEMPDLSKYSSHEFSK